MEQFLTLMNHVIPLIITLFALLILVALAVGTPYCRYVSFVSNAGTKEGKEDLAKYLAHKAGGRKIRVEHTWRSFLPAATDLHAAHVEKRNKLHNL